MCQTQIHGEYSEYIIKINNTGCKTRKNIKYKKNKHLLMKLFLNKVDSICESRQLWPQFLREFSTLLFIGVGSSGCRQ